MAADLDTAIQDTITALLAKRAEGATICPSEVARAIDPDGWRDLMEPVRTVALREVDRGTLEVRQGGKPVTGPEFQGPIRLGRPGEADG